MLKISTSNKIMYKISSVYQVNCQAISLEKKPLMGAAQSQVPCNLETIVNGTAL